MGHGALGDVTFQRRDGRQISSVRVRVQTNPKSDEQCIARTIFSTIAQAYAKGKYIFDHSFEGATTPAENQSRFYKANLARLRKILTDGDIHCEKWDESSANFTCPQAPVAVPNAYIISEGSLNWPSDIFHWEPNKPWWLRFNDDMFPRTILVRDWLEIFPYDATDLFTFVTFVIRYPAQFARIVSKQGATVPYPSGNELLQSDFYYYRFHLKEDLTDYLDMQMWQCFLGDLFIIESNQDPGQHYHPQADVSWNTGISMAMLNQYNSNAGSCGLIYSKVNDGRRSKTQMQICRPYEYGQPYDFGVVGGWILNSWLGYR